VRWPWRRGRRWRFIANGIYAPDRDFMGYAYVRQMVGYYVNGEGHRWIEGTNDIPDENDRTGWLAGSVAESVAIVAGPNRFFTNWPGDGPGGVDRAG